MNSPAIRPKDRDAVLQSLRAGVVPRRGLQHIQVGRKDEIAALVRDIDRIVDGGAAIRLIIGEYGSGKTFFLNLVRSVALEKKLVAAQADLTPGRRLHASGGQAQNLYQELMRNLSTRTKPDGGAMPSIVERFISQAAQDAHATGTTPDLAIKDRLDHLTELVNGYDFATVIGAYWRGHEEHNDQLQQDAIRWLRGEFKTKTDARNALGVRSIIDDDNVHDMLKLFARFVRLAGYDGLLVNIDEMVNLYKLTNTQARNGNYEQLLRILNDCLQGSAEGIGFLFGVTPESLMNTRRGIYSYEALRSRLAENTYATDGLIDLSGPVVRLANLSPEDMYVLLMNLRHVHAGGHEDAYLLPDEGLEAFMAHCRDRIGDAYFRTPRNTVTQFINLLAVLEQNPGQRWQDLLPELRLDPDTGEILEGEASPQTPPSSNEKDSGLKSFKL